MNKKFYCLLAFLMAAIVSVSFVSCSSDEKESESFLVGTWELEDGGTFLILTFNSDGTGYSIENIDEREDFEWTFNEETMRIRVHNLKDDNYDTWIVEKLTSKRIIIKTKKGEGIFIKK